jgi:hypothetical protein
VFERGYYLASEQKIRRETNSGQEYLVLLQDIKNRTVTQIELKSHSVVPDIPIPDTSKTVYRKLGTEELIAGIRCVDWASAPVIRGLPSSLGTTTTPKIAITNIQCISDDGVLLKSDTATTVNGRMTHVTTKARDVVYGPLDSKLFSIQ